MSPNSQKLGLQKWQRAFPSHRQKKKTKESSLRVCTVTLEVFPFVQAQLPQMAEQSFPCCSLNMSFRNLSVKERPSGFLWKKWRAFCCCKRGAVTVNSLLPCTDFFSWAKEQNWYKVIVKEKLFLKSIRALLNYSLEPYLACKPYQHAVWNGLLQKHSWKQSDR